MNEKHGHPAAIVAVILGVLLILSLVFGIWAFMGMQENQTNLDNKIEAASATAVKEAEAAKEVEFTEREKDPYRPFSGSATYGSLNFNFPKSWSAYVEESTSGEFLDFYAHPNLVPGKNDQISYALRAQIVDDDYATVLEQYSSNIEDGTLTADAYRAEKVPQVLGTLLRGEIDSEKQGTMILLPQRDKTIKIWTESSEYLNDFTKISKTITFVP